jgi:hypothetical protein
MDASSRSRRRTAARDRVDLGHLLDQVGLVAVMGQRVVAIGDVDLAVGARGAFVRDQECDHARQVRLEGHRHHVGHQLEVLGEIGGDAVGLLHVRIDLRVVLLGFFDLALDLADRRQIFVELAAVGGAEVGFQLARVVADEIENAAAIQIFARAGRGRQRHAVAEQPFEKRARVEHRRQRLGLALPGQIIGVSAGITRVAIAGLARIFHAQFERREARLLAHLVGHDLVERDAGLDIDYGFARLDAGQVEAQQRP